MTEFHIQYVGHKRRSLAECLSCPLTMELEDTYCQALSINKHKDLQVMTIFTFGWTCPLQLGV